MTAAAAGPVPPPPPNWYLDPHDSAQQRWWSGRDWTAYTRTNLPDPHGPRYAGPQAPMYAGPQAPYSAYAPIAEGVTTRLRKTNGIGFAGAVVGLGSFVIDPLCLTSVTGIVLCIIGLVNDESRRNSGAPAVGRGWIIAGLVCSVVTGLIYGAILFSGVARSLSTN